MSISLLILFSDAPFFFWGGEAPPAPLLARAPRCFDGLDVGVLCGGGQKQFAKADLCISDKQWQAKSILAQCCKKNLNNQLKLIRYFLIQ